MSAFQFRNFFFGFVIVMAGVGVSFAQPPATDEKKKKEEPPTKEELELRQGSKDLVYKFVQGDEIHCQARRKRTEKRNVNETLSDESREIEFGLVLTVAKTLPNGGAEINAIVDWVTLEAKGRWLNKWDARVDKDPQDSEGWALHHKAKFSFKVDPQGNVTDVKPDAETREYWQQQPRELKALVTPDVIKSLLPFVPLPKDLARRGTDWKEKRMVLDEALGAREVTLNFSYHGSETIRGNIYEDIRIRGEAKQTDERPKYEIVEHTGSGSMSFDRRFGCLRTFRFDEKYVFNPPGAPLVELPLSEKEKEAEEKKEKKKKMGVGGAGGGLGQGGGMSGGGRGKGGGGGGQKKTKEERKKEEEEEKKRPKSKIVEVQLENEVRITYRGKPISAQ
jgi:uncharacterized membrane protein YgcG